MGRSSPLCVVLVLLLDYNNGGPNRPPVGHPVGVGGWVKGRSALCHRDDYHWPVFRQARALRESGGAGRGSIRLHPRSGQAGAQRPLIHS